MLHQGTLPTIHDTGLADGCRIESDLAFLFSNVPKCENNHIPSKTNPNGKAAKGLNPIHSSCSVLAGSASNKTCVCVCVDLLFPRHQIHFEDSNAQTDKIKERFQVNFICLFLTVTSSLPRRRLGVLGLSGLRSHVPRIVN